jgi:hypothetical protein
LEPKQDEFVNTWKPITEKYAEADVPQVARPASPVQNVPADAAPPKTEDQKQAKPKMHGVAHVDIPVQYRPVENQPHSRRPILISIVAVYMLIKAVISLLLALVPWGDPDSGVASFLTANPSLAFSMLPRMFRPIPGMPAAAQSTYVQGLPFLFLFVAVLCGLLAFKLWTLSEKWRWATAFWALYSLVSTVRFLVLDSIIRSSVAINFPPMSNEYKLAILFSIAWNLLIVCYLSFYPGVKDAFERGY